MLDPSPIKIVAIDPKRPPVLRAAPYIELFFELSEPVQTGWREDFNSLLAKHMSRPKVDADAAQFIETWVRTPADIAKHLDLLQQTVAQCNSRASERARVLHEASLSGSEAGSAVSDEQRALNDAVAALVFDA